MTALSKPSFCEPEVKGTTDLTRVVYLLGAGATQACVSRVRSPHRILMQDLSPALAIKLHNLVNQAPYDHPSLKHLVNSVIDDDTDFEHVITFLDNAPSSLHRDFADKMKQAFQQVLSDRLAKIRADHGGDPTELYNVLIDLHNIPDCPEHLQAILTTNYDEYLEIAIAKITECAPDFGIAVDSESCGTNGPQLLKLHGSLGWRDTWPISTRSQAHGILWIPPGIHKTKQNYPFNLLWGRAAEVLNCDILRIVGCRLAPNDWDLISLLFSSRHINFPTAPEIEVIDSPQHVEDLKQQYPYLEIRSMLEDDPVGTRIIAEILGTMTKPYVQLTEDDQLEVVERAGWRRNWFELWLTQKVEQLNEDLDTVTTTAGVVDEFIAK